jgi:asparagine synthase (glutamine-hydrolysing)
LLPPTRFADESPFVEQTRTYVGNIVAKYLRAEHVSPLSGLRRMLEIRCEPGHAGGNHYWLVAVLEQAQREGHNVLLTGQLGNATISWTGLNVPALRHFVGGRRERGIYALQTAYAETGLWRMLRTQFASTLIQPVRAWAQARREPAWHSYSAIHPAFAARLNLFRRMRDTGHDPAFSSPNDPRIARCLIIRPGHSQLGALWQDNGTAFGLEARDPTLDKRVMEFCLGVPEDQYLQAGRDRMLIRRAMEGYLPDSVRLTPRRGRQAADLGHRLIRHRGEMEDALARLRASPLTQSMLDLDWMQTVWNALQARVDVETTEQSQTILTRGVTAGLYLLTFD